MEGNEPLVDENTIANAENTATESEESQNISNELATDETSSDKLFKELEESKDKYLRLYSEFDNFRRRTQKEKSDIIATASRSVIESLLPVQDDFERALKILSEKIDKEHLEGITLIYNKFTKALELKGLKPMSVQTGDTFDPEMHEAITQIPAPSPEMEGKIIDIVEKGYLLNEKVIRFAKVVTGAKN